MSGHGLIQERKIGTDEVIEFEVSGEKIEAIHMLPGYTHNIINLSETENLVTVMWANEQFDPNHPDTFFEKVEEGVHISPGTVIKAENRIPRATKIEAGEVVPLRAYPL